MTQTYLGASASSSTSSEVMHRSAPGMLSLVGRPPTAITMLRALYFLPSTYTPGDWKRAEGSEGHVRRVERAREVEGRSEEARDIGSGLREERGRDAAFKRRGTQVQV